MAIVKKTDEATLLSLLASGEISLQPLSLRDIQVLTGKDDADALMTAKWRGRQYSFVVECKARSTPKMVREAITQVRQYARRTKRNPLILVPYLRDAQLKELEAAGVSAVDACGNAAIVVPGRLLVYRSGQPNLFRDATPLKNPYRGDASLVARLLLRVASFPSVTAVRDAILDHGGNIAMSTVSKALKRMEDDLIVERSTAVRCVQQDKLLAKLVENYQPPRMTTRIVGKTSVAELVDAARRQQVRFVATGTASASAYVIDARPPRMAFYCSDLSALVSLPGLFEATSLFANVEMIGTQDQWVYFDPNNNGPLPYASPVQSYLELASGDKRDRDGAKQVLKWLPDHNAQAEAQK